MPDWDVKYGIPARQYRVENARDIHHAGLVFQRNLPKGARPGMAVYWVSQADHKAWFEWPGLIRHGDKVQRALVTYEHKGELYTHKVFMRAKDHADARALLEKNIKTLQRVDFIPTNDRHLTDEQEEELQDFIDRWNGDA